MAPDQKTTEKDEATVQLIDDEGDITDELEICLKHIFAKYCKPSPLEDGGAKEGMTLLEPPEGAYLDSDALDAWAKDTNGAPLGAEEKKELQMLDVTDEGNLTFSGFIQLYQLQSDNDEEETWRDLARHGFDRSLKLVAKKAED
ncbi:hypothetical protein FA95DRAFT_1555209 [Auriscalpium vulgare]|uniref:Uncharacterized protein n=1 Tax=Auriscalpium vulgare TaxID=40419 RepID=A0ACB8S488_9AGAM|nr:hypothetical protein FA95DRAFT_1555209 [Auriscalpium vulgare]